MKDCLKGAAKIARRRSPVWEGSAEIVKQRDWKSKRPAYKDFSLRPFLFIYNTAMTGAEKWLKSSKQAMRRSKRS